MATLTNKLKQLAGMKGVHYFLTRFGPTSLRKISFDEKYLNGNWKHFKDKPDVALAEIVEQYCHKGDILTLGCGVAAVAGGLSDQAFNTFHGVDLSDAAIAIARRRENSWITFEVGDMTNYQFKKPYEVILLSESVYYIPKGQMETQLNHLKSGLAPNGSIIITVAEPKRYEWIIDLIRARHHIVEDRNFSNSSRRLLVFK